MMKNMISLYPINFSRMSNIRYVYLCGDEFYFWMRNSIQINNYFVFLIRMWMECTVFESNMNSASGKLLNDLQHIYVYMIYDYYFSFCDFYVCFQTTQFFKTKCRFRYTLFSHFLLYNNEPNDTQYWYW